MPAMVMLVALASVQSLHFPPAASGWERVEPAAGWDEQALAAALEFAGARRSTSVVVLHKGKLMMIRRWDPARRKTSARFAFERMDDGQVLEDVASVQKSVTAVLLAIARHKRLLTLDDPVSEHLGAGWSKAAGAGTPHRDPAPGHHVERSYRGSGIRGGAGHEVVL